MVKNRRPKGYWTQENVLKELNERKDKGLGMGAAEVAADNSSLYYNAGKYYGSWYKALATIGEDVEGKDGRKKHEAPGFWTAEQVVIEIKKLSDRGEDLTVVNIRKDHGSLIARASIFYGGWYAALEASGLSAHDYRERKEKGFWTNENIVASIQERADMGLSLVTSDVSKEDGGLYAAGVSKYGSWVTALTASGIDVTNYLNENTQGYWTEGRVRTEMKRRYDSGQSMKTGDIKSGNRALYERARKVFGNYKEALEQCVHADKK